MITPVITPVITPMITPKITPMITRHCTAPHRTAPHRTAPHRTEPCLGPLREYARGRKFISISKKTLFPTKFGDELRRTRLTIYQNPGFKSRPPKVSRQRRRREGAKVYESPACPELDIEAADGKWHFRQVAGWSQILSRIFRSRWAC